MDLHILHGFTATPTLTQPRDPQTSDEFFRMDRWPGDPVAPELDDRLGQRR